MSVPSDKWPEERADIVQICKEKLTVLQDRIRDCHTAWKAMSVHLRPIGSQTCGLWTERSDLDFLIRRRSGVDYMKSITQVVLAHGGQVKRAKPGRWLLALEDATMDVNFQRDNCTATQYSALAKHVISAERPHGRDQHECALLLKRLFPPPHGIGGATLGLLCDVVRGEDNTWPCCWGSFLASLLMFLDSGRHEAWVVRDDAARMYKDGGKRPSFAEVHSLLVPPIMKPVPRRPEWEDCPLQVLDPWNSDQCFTARLRCVHFAAWCDCIRGELERHPCCCASSPPPHGKSNGGEEQRHPCGNDRRHGLHV